MEISTAPLSPEQFAQETAAALPQCTPGEGRKLLKLARAWAIVSYNGDVPPALAERLAEMETLCPS
jgi:hypothetical protein